MAPPNKAIQRKSVANSAGLAGKSKLLARIFFAFDSAALDNNDREVLQFVSRHIRRQLPLNRVELSFVGFADSRGAVSYNIGLGERRAQAVRAMLDGLVGKHDNYSSFDAISLGEGGAHQKSPTEDQMAEDRHVDILISAASRPSPPKPEPAPDIKPIKVQRYTRRAFSEFTAEQFSSKPPNFESDAVKSLLKLASKLAADPANSLDDKEVVSLRRTADIPVNHRVNHMFIDLKYSVNTVTFGMLTFSFTSILYGWGVPAPFLIIDTKQAVEMQDTPFKTIFFRTQIPREEADKNPLTFPPDPAKSRAQ